MANNPDYKNLAAKLKKLGVLNYDLRKPLSTGQKANITKKANQFAGVLSRPGMYFKLGADKKTIRNAHQAEYLTSKTSIFIKRKPFYTSASIKNGVITLKELQGDGSRELEYKIHLPGTKEFFKLSEKLAKQPRNKNQWLTLKIGGNAPFNRTFQNVNQLLNYLSSFKLKDGGNWEELMPEISLVTMKTNVGF